MWPCTMARRGRRPNRYFFHLKKIKARRSHISSVYDLNGTEVSSQEEIERAHIDFYSQLFSKEPIDAALQDDLDHQDDCRVNFPPIKRRLA